MNISWEYCLVVIGTSVMRCLDNEWYSVLQVWLGRAEASPTVITHTRKLPYLCMYMYVRDWLTVYMYTVCSDTSFKHSSITTCVHTYCKSINIINVHVTSVSLNEAHQSCSQCQNVELEYYNSSVNSQQVATLTSQEGTYRTYRTTNEVVRSRLKLYTALQRYLWPINRSLMLIVQYCTKHSKP